MQAQAHHIETQTISSAQSLKVVQTLLKAGLGCITFMRDLLPQDNFTESHFTTTDEADEAISSSSSNSTFSSPPRGETKSLEGFKIMTISQGLTDEADRLLNYLEYGIFDALQRQYLENFVFAIYLSSYRQANAEDVARQISPVSMLNESIVVEAPGSMLSPHPPTRAHMPDHTRQESESSITSLPTPPRRTPTPSRLLIDRVEPTMPRTIATSSPTFSYSPITRPAAVRPTLSPRNLAPSSPASLRRINEGARLSDASTSSSISSDLDITAWLARQNPDGSMPSAEMRHQPMLSAVQPNFPASANSVNPSASPAARLRPLLLASVERTGSMVLAEHYNRLYPYPPTDEQSR